MRREKKNEKYFQSQMTSVPMEIVKLEDNSFHLLVKAEIEGVNGDLIIDTGASVTVADRQLFREKISGREQIKLQSGSVTGQIENIGMIKAEKIKIGGYNLRHLPLALINLDYVNNMYSQHLNRKVLGLLGSDFCLKYKAIINYRTRELQLWFPSTTS